MSKLTRTGFPFLVAGLLLGQPTLAAQPAGHSAHSAQPPQAIVKELMTRDLPDIPGKEVLMITVDYPPGAVDPVHRHDADSYVYVLEGSIVMQVQGGEEVTLTAGQTFYEGPDDIHTVGRNASQTRPARFLVVLVKEKGVPFFIPVK